MKHITGGKMKHIMLDLETMGNGNNAAIVAIGACEFDPYGADRGAGFPDVPVGATFYQRVGLESSVQAGMQIDASTVLWWMQQSDAARKSTFFQGAAMPLDDVCWQFTKFVTAVSGHDEKGVAIWGNGATFDNVIIRSTFAAMKLPVPWSFRNDKCYRTVINLLPESRRPPFARSGTAHNALDDAITQARYLQQVYKELGL